MAEPLDSDRWEEDLHQLWSALETDDTLFFPVRHHSPACAWHLTQLIRNRQPVSILLEGPESFTATIPHLVHPETRAPVALYTQFVDKKRRTGSADRETDSTPRFSAFFPLCDYSPELVALREGAAVGARLRFFDLDFPDQVIAEADHRRASDGRAESLLDETHLVQSSYLAELARRRRCRDANELWDRLFECDFVSTDTSNFIKNVATYCFLARVTTPVEILEGDGTLARERVMAQRLNNERKRLRRNRRTGPILVVTGGFHTPPLALGGAGPSQAAERAKVGEDETLRALIPYSFEQLDALHGYAAGMPSPFYYQRLWEMREQPHAEALEQLARELLVELPRRMKLSRSSDARSTADAIGALQQARALAAFRGHPGPLREDLLDGIRASFIRGELDPSSSIVLEMALELMRGDTIGAIPSSVDELPILSDFQRLAKYYSLRLDSTAPRELSLEIYRKDRHRKLSQLLHRLEFLEVPFGRFMSGPDFVNGRGLELQVERWTYSWSPQTNGRLVDCSVYGATIEEAVVQRLEERIRTMREEGGDGGAREAVFLLTVCCTMGLDDRVAALSPEVMERLRNESSFAASASAASQLELLTRFSGPIETPDVPQLPGLLDCAYRRCCHLMSAFDRIPKEAVDDTLYGLAQVREILIRDERRVEPAVDPDLFWSAAAYALEGRPLRPELAGGLVGLTYSAGKMTVEGLLARIENGIAGHDEDGSTAPGFLRGLFMLSREITWQQPEIMKRIDELLSGWSESEFLAALPFLRLAFSGHTPSETDQVARLLSGLNDGLEIGELYLRDLDESDLARNTRIASRVRETLAEERLLSWTDDDRV